MAAAGCNSDTSSPTSPTVTTPTVAEATVSELFTGVVPVGGYSFYSFTTTLNGTVRLTLTSVSGAGVPSTVWLGLGIGVPAAEDCVTTTVVNTSAGGAAQITGTLAPGVYCAKVYDIGNLFAPASVDVTIEHPE